MVDSNSMETTALYFTILDILRVMDEWIRGSQRLNAFKNFWKAMKHQDKSDVAIINSNWEVLISRHDDIIKTLRERISRKTEEIKSLRDGVSPDSFREISKNLLRRGYNSCSTPLISSRPNRVAESTNLSSSSPL